MWLSQVQCRAAVQSYCWNVKWVCRFIFFLSGQKAIDKWWGKPEDKDTYSLNSILGQAMTTMVIYCPAIKASRVTCESCPNFVLVQKAELPDGKDVWIPSLQPLYNSCFPAWHHTEVTSRTTRVHLCKESGKSVACYILLLQLDDPQATFLLFGRATCQRLWLPAVWVNHLCCLGNNHGQEMGGSPS